MSKIKYLIDEILYEKKIKNIKVFYNVDIFIQDFENEEEEEKPTQNKNPENQPQQPPPEATPASATDTVPPPTPDIAVESSKNKGKIITEDIFKERSEGTFEVPVEKAKTILTLNDLIAYLNRHKDDNGKAIINDLVQEAIMSLTGQNTENAIEDILHEGDKMNITIDYGFDVDDSIGLQISKNPGVKMATVVMRQDGKPFSGAFNLAIFNQTITNVFLKEMD